ncbi:MAG: putative RDD family membrane protein YckC [Psychrobacter glaciei]|jgi:uncharacterized RDD family membrane protein YckC
MKKNKKQNKTETAIQVSNAGPLVRLAAMLYDALLMLAMWLVAGGIAVAINGGEQISTNNPFLPSIMFIVWIWFNLHFWRRGGQTLGMRSWRLRILSTTCKPLTYTQCLLRLVVAVPSCALFYLGYLWILVDKDGLAWHDRYSETRIIREPKSAK